MAENTALGTRQEVIGLAKRMPKFKSESEEADWWYANRYIIRLDRTELDTARRLAAKNGTRYQTLLKNLIAAGLRGLERSAS